MSLAKKLAKGALSKGFSLAKKVAKSTPLGMVASAGVGLAGGFMAGRASKGGGKKRRRTTPAKLMNRIRIFKLKKELAKVRGY